MSQTGAAIEETFRSDLSSTTVAAAAAAKGAQIPPSLPIPRSEKDRKLSTVSNSVPSSPISSAGPKIFSDDAKASSSDDESELSSAPEETPPKPLPFVLPLASRKPAFAFLKRKRTCSDEDSTPNFMLSCTASSNKKRPLGEISANVSKKPKLTDSKSFTQLQIDLGDAVQKECKACGMEYVPSNSEDAALHREYHDLHTSGVDLGKGFTKDPGVKALYTGDIKALKEDEVVVSVDRSSLPKTKAKVRRVLELVNAELSATDISEDMLWSPVGIPTAQQAMGKDLRKGTREQMDDGGARFKGFLVLSKEERCIAFCLVEKIKAAYKVVAQDTSSDHDATKENDGDDIKKPEDSLTSSIKAPQSSSIQVSSMPSLALLGISRIWTSRKYRGRGLATTLLDIARRNFFYGIEVPKHLTAFSQPTESGGNLARCWYGKEDDWLVFKEEQE